ncbi:MAG TPA: TOBE domain-containing protein, partial [Rhizomicrobium sp.]|nr:TOBE domain-containing protein [Rhizomicrobium sp.]
APRELYERPNCRQVADFIGEMNFFHASVRQIEDADVTVNAGILGILTFPRANLAPGIRPDEHILLAIRPEHIRFADSGLAGEIADATFLGERSHFHVKIAGRSDLIAISGHAAPAGKAVHLAFPPEKLIGLPTGD